MSTWTYLDSYLSSIPAAQKQNLLNLIYGQVLNGSITTTGQYQVALNSLLAQLAPGLTAPTFKQYIAPFQSVTRSPDYNAMETQAISALGILYKECNLLDQAITDYQNVTNGNLDAIEATTANLEAQISALELLSANTDGYTSTVYDSFNESNSHRLTRSQSIPSTPFIVQNNVFIPAEYDAQIINNQLQLPVISSTPYIISNIALSGLYPSPSAPGVATSSDLPVSSNPYDISNILLNDPTKYWAETVDLNTLFTNTVSSSLTITLAGTQSISNIYIDPFTRFPYNIDSIWYTVNNTSANIGGGLSGIIEITDLDYPITISTATNITFPSITADTIILNISQSNYSALRYIEPASTGIISSLLDIADNGVLSSNATLPNTYAFTMTSIMQNLLNIGAETANATNTVNVYEFLYGAKQIELSENKYSYQGIFVTQPYTINNCAAIALNTTDNIPADTAIEYNILVDFYNTVNGSPVFQESLGTVPILPATEDNVFEILDGTNNTVLQNWTATTRFGTSNLNSITVYQNGTKVITNSCTLTQNPSGTVTITIHDSIIPSYIRDTSVFTITYNTNIAANIITLPKYSQAVITLQIFLRSITPNTTVSPTVSSYSMQFKAYTGN